MRKTLSDKGVAALKPRAGRYAYPDPECRGHFVRVQPSGAKSFVAVTRGPDGKQVWTTISATDRMTIEQARDHAREAFKRVRAGLPAVEPRGETVATVIENWNKRHVEGVGLRSHRKLNRLLALHVLPVWKDREFTSIRRSDVAALLDHIEDEHSPRQADHTLAVVRSIMNWYATRADDYSPPVVKGMRRNKAVPRARILDDDELRRLWEATEGAGVFNGMTRLCLYTGQRSRKVATLKWSDIIDGEWIIATAPREKGNAGSLVLPEAALAVIKAQPQIGDNPYIFASPQGDNKWLSGFSKAKDNLDAKLPGMPHWTLHDLRRTARSLMSRAGVATDISERVLGHALPGMRGVYDRHAYRAEKADALARLAALIDAIVHPRSADVLPMKQKGQSAASL
jgi:integrase